MGQTYVEQAIGRILTDAEFRDSCITAPRACLGRHYGSNLSAAETEALVRTCERLSIQAFARVGALVDSRIRRADLRPLSSASVCIGKLEGCP